MKDTRWWLFLAIVALLSLVVSPALFAVLSIVIIGYIVFVYPLVGLYGIVLLAPMTGLVFWGDWLYRMTGLSIVSTTFFAPMVDVWTVFVLIIFGIRMGVSYFEAKPRALVLPGVWLYGFFLLSGVVSLLHLPGAEMIEGLKYLVRFPLFVYIGYLVLGMQLIDTRTVLHRCLKLFVWVAVFAACQGLLSLIINISGFTGLYRAVPLAIFGVDVFNFAGDVRYGHILLAEHLTVAIPMAVYLAYHARGSARRLYTFVSVFLVSICILTFSRAGWLTLGVQFIVCLFAFRSHIAWKRYVAYVPVLVLLLILPTAYMISTLSSRTVTASNEARITLTEIGLYHFFDRPVFGQGVGTFVPLLEDTYFFTYHFGAPTDAHSIFTKLTTEQGMVGLVTFLLFIGWILFDIYKRMKDEGYTADARMAAVLGLFLVLTPLFFQLFNTQYYAARMWVPILFALSLVFLYRDDRSRASAYISFLPPKRIDVVSNVFKK